MLLGGEQGVNDKALAQWKTHTRYSGQFSADHDVILWFWEVLEAGTPGKRLCPCAMSWLLLNRCWLCAQNSARRCSGSSPAARACRREASSQRSEDTKSSR